MVRIYCYNQLGYNVRTNLVLTKFFVKTAMKMQGITDVMMTLVLTTNEAGCIGILLKILQPDPIHITFQS